MPVSDDYRAGWDACQQMVTDLLSEEGFAVRDAALRIPLQDVGSNPARKARENQRARGPLFKQTIALRKAASRVLYLLTEARKGLT